MVVKITIGLLGVATLIGAFALTLFYFNPETTITTDLTDQLESARTASSLQEMHESLVVLTESIEEVGTQVSPNRRKE